MLRLSAWIGVYPNVSIHDKSVFFLALISTRHSNAFNNLASNFPILPNPAIKQLLPNNILLYSFKAIDMALSAVGRALKIINSSLAEKSLTVRFLKLLLTLYNMFFLPQNIILFFNKSTNLSLIMIVDDEPDISELLEKALKIEGFQKLPEKGVFRSIYAALNQMDAEIRRSDRMKEETERTRREWIANITHDLKTPLSPIKGYAELLADGTAGEPQTVREYGSLILKNAEHTEKLINDLVHNPPDTKVTVSVRKDQGNGVCISAFSYSFGTHGVITKLSSVKFMPNTHE